MTRQPADPLNADISYKELQEYVWQKNIERGFNTEDPTKKLVLLTEEVGELARAVRKSTGMKFSATTSTSDLAEELADVQIVLLGLASILKIDMIEAVTNKENKNIGRVWK